MLSQPRHRTVHPDVRSAKNRLVALKGPLEGTSLAFSLRESLTPGSVLIFCTSVFTAAVATVCSYLSRCAAKDRIRNAGLSTKLRNICRLRALIDSFVLLSKLENSTLLVKTWGFARTLSLSTPQWFKKIFKWQNPMRNIARYNFQVAELRYFLKGLIVLRIVVLTGSASSRDVLLHIFAR